MGKRQIKTAADESKITREVSQRVLRKAKKKHIEQGKAYVHATYNNTIVTITDEKGQTLASSSAGVIGFKGAKKSTPYAAQIIVERMHDQIQAIGLKEVDVFVRGIGGGRESAVRTLQNIGLNINFIKDVTPIPHNGCRPRKVRRV